MQVGYPEGFINSVFNDYLNPRDNDMIIPEWLFDDRERIVIKLPYCYSNETLSKTFLSRLFVFTGDKYKLMIVWETRKVRTLFPLKDKVKHASCIIYEGNCTCGSTYIGESIRNADTRWSEHAVSSNESEPSKHLLTNPTHSFTWTVLSMAARNILKRKILEAYFIIKFKPSLNEQLDQRRLVLFKHGVT